MTDLGRLLDLVAPSRVPGGFGYLGSDASPGTWRPGHGARDVAQRHGGTLALEPGAGGGARFVLRLPPAPEAV